MGFSIETRKDKKGAVCRAKITGEMTIYAATKMKQGLLAPLDQGEDIELDLSEVSEIDSAGLQVLLLAKQEAARRGKKLGFRAHSPAVLEAIDLTGLASVFGDAVVIPSP